MMSRLDGNKPSAACRALLYARLSALAGLVAGGPRKLNAGVNPRSGIFMTRIVLAPAAANACTALTTPPTAVGMTVAGFKLRDSMSPMSFDPEKTMYSAFGSWTLRALNACTSAFNDHGNNSGGLGGLGKGPPGKGPPAFCSTVL